MGLRKRAVSGHFLKMCLKREMYFFLDGRPIFDESKFSKINKSLKNIISQKWDTHLEKRSFLLLNMFLKKWLLTASSLDPYEAVGGPKSRAKV